MTLWAIRKEYDGRFYILMGPREVLVGSKLGYRTMRGAKIAKTRLFRKYRADRIYYAIFGWTD